jgi:hypothetical protein
MVQQGQVFQLTRCGSDGEPLWAYRYRTGGRDAKRIQRGGFASEQDARESLERELERLRREARIARRVTLDELVGTYLAQHDVQPVTIEKLRYLLSKATLMPKLNKLPGFKGYRHRSSETGRPARGSALSVSQGSLRESRTGGAIRNLAARTRA